LDRWLQAAGESGIVQMKRFADSLWCDYEAVRAALELPWSNGPVEGEVNQLKLIKRTMYGRAGFELLTRRVLSDG
jgi:transposase